MPIERVVIYTCDCCGREIDYQKDRYQELSVRSYNYMNLMRDDCDDTYIYCNNCSSYMWKAVYAIPQIREVAVNADGPQEISS